MINSKGNREFEMQNSEFKIRNVADIETLSIRESEAGESADAMRETEKSNAKAGS